MEEVDIRFLYLGRSCDNCDIKFSLLSELYYLDATQENAQYRL